MDDIKSNYVSATKHSNLKNPALNASDNSIKFFIEPPSLADDSLDNLDNIAIEKKLYNGHQNAVRPLHNIIIIGLISVEAYRLQAS